MKEQIGGCLLKDASRQTAGTGPLGEDTFSPTRLPPDISGALIHDPF